MGQRDRVLFIQPPTSFSQTSPCLDDKQFGLGLLANAAWLEAHGFGVCGLHISLALHYGFEEEDVKAFILKEDPIVIAIGLNWVHFSSGALEVACLVKALPPHVPVYIGGQHATMFAEEIANTNTPYVDGVIRGEANHALTFKSDHSIGAAQSVIGRFTIGITTPPCHLLSANLSKATTREVIF